MTDFGTRDSYAGSMKGVILNIFPRATVVDLTHEIEPQNVKQGAFILEAAYPYFPSGSLFVSVVDPGVGSERRILAVKTKTGIFLVPDNGLITRILQREKLWVARAVTNQRFFMKKISSTFHGRDCFAPTAAHLAKNPEQFYKLGPLITNPRRLSFPEPKKQGKKWIGEIIYFDHFGNAFTNIPRNLVGLELKNALRVRIGRRNLGFVRRSYFEVEKGKAVAVFSSTDLVEIAVNHGSARKNLKLREGTPVEIF